MLKHCLVFTILFYTWTSTYAQKGSCRPDSSHFFRYRTDTPTLPKILTGITYNTYNEKRQPLETYVHSLWNFSMGAWQWLPQFKYIHVYSPDGLMSEYWTQAWDTISQSWKDQERKFYYYNSKQQMISETDQDQKSGYLENAYQHVVTYTPEGREQNRLLYRWEVDQGWSNHLQFTYYYNAQGLLDSFYQRMWNNVSSNYVNNRSVVYTYDANGREKEKLEYSWGWGFPENQHKIVKSYNTEGLLKEEISQFWYKDNGSYWRNAARFIYQYNNEGCLLNHHDYYWGDEKWMDFGEEIFFYPGPPSEQLSVYPNPAKSTFYIRTPAETTYKLMDMSGKTVLEGTVAAGENQVDIQHLSSGIYILITPLHNQKLVIQ